jgi:saccharopine dehydrogenase-like NADP-dependent oxidoreductase
MAVVLVLGGCGEMGSVAVRDLTERTDHDVIIGDLDSTAAGLLASTLPRHVSSEIVDVEDDTSLRAALARADVVLNATFMRWVPRVTRAAIDAGVHLVDLGAYWPETAAQLEMDEAARTSEMRVVPGCGVAPGLTNVLARAGADRMDAVESIRFSSYITHPITTSPGIVYTRFDASTGMALVLRQGELVEVPAFSEEETVEFAPPYGEHRIHLVPHPEPLTLPRYISGLREVDFKVGYPEDDTRRLNTLLDLGFDSAEPRSYGDTKIVPRDFAAAFVGGIGLGPAERTANVKRVVVRGRTALGAPARIVYDFATENVGKTASSAITGTMAAIAAALVADGGGQPGVHPPEGAFDPLEVLGALKARGFEITETEDS